jgi:hypothetical protein
MTGSNPHRQKQTGNRKQILTDKNVIPISDVITPAYRHYIKAVMVWLTTRLSDNLSPFYQQQKEEEGSTSTYALTGHTTQNQQNRLWPNEVMFPAYHTKEREARKKSPEKIGSVQKEMSFCKKQAMGCGENKLMAQQVQETIHKVWKESRELHWFGSVIMEYHHLQKDNFGIGSKWVLQLVEYYLIYVCEQSQLFFYWF